MPLSYIGESYNEVDNTVEMPTPHPTQPLHICIINNRVTNSVGRPATGGTNKCTFYALRSIQVDVLRCNRAL